MDSCNPERVLLKIIYLLHFKLLISVNLCWKNFWSLRFVMCLITFGRLSQPEICVSGVLCCSAHKEVRSSSFNSFMLLFFCLNKPVSNSNYTQLQRNMKSSGQRSICSSILQSHLLLYEAVDMLILSLTVVAHLC